MIVLDKNEWIVGITPVCAQGAMTGAIKGAAQVF
jgi:hypothetical protein